MNDEQNSAGNGSETNNAAGNETAATGGTSDSGTPSARLQEEYYAVDHAKKDVISTIGDGEMHNEGLAGAPDALTNLMSSTDRLSDEQDVAESHDSEQ